MGFYDIMKRSFYDELEKISGELQGHVRSGRKPIGVDRLLEREGEESVSPSAAFPSGLSKVSFAPVAAAAIPLMAAGAYGHHKANQALNYYRIGKQVSRQQQPMGYQ